MTLETVKPYWPIFYDGFARLIGEESLALFSHRLGLQPKQLDPIFGLTDLQQLSIYLYTTPLDYCFQLNSALRDWNRFPGDALPFELLVFAMGLENALRKLPVYSGFVYRGIHHPATVSERLRLFAPGAVLQWKSFTSCSREQDRAYVGNTEFRIMSRTGRSLA
jgi:hypothetical protein